MIKYVCVVIPSFEVEFGPVRQEGEAGLRKPGPPLPLQQRVEFCLERVKMKHIGGGIAELLWRERGLAPIRGLLLLRNFHPQKLAAQVLQAVPVGKGTHELCGNFGAVHGLRGNAEIML